MKLIIDTFGTDHGPESVCQGVMSALKKYDFYAILVGEKALVDRVAKDHGVSPDAYEVLETDHAISNHDDPARSIRRDPEASQVLGLERLNEGDADGFLSGGSTGALLAGGLFITKRIKGVDRAALTTTLPGKKGPFILLDAGANMDTSPDMVKQFALMGSSYAEVALGKANPRVGLLNVGAEPGKGDKRSKEAYELLQDAPINFVGNIESRDILENKADVIVTDGFAGNIVLKALEGTLSTVLTMLKEAVMSSTRSKIGGLLLKPALKKVMARFSTKDIGAAPLLGVQKSVFKMHGNSDAETVCVGIKNLIDYIDGGVTEKIRAKFIEEQDASV